MVKEIRETDFPNWKDWIEKTAIEFAAFGVFIAIVTFLNTEKANILDKIVSGMFMFFALLIWKDIEGKFEINKINNKALPLEVLIKSLLILCEPLLVLYWIINFKIAAALILPLVATVMAIIKLIMIIDTIKSVHGKAKWIIIKNVFLLMLYLMLGIFGFFFQNNLLYILNIIQTIVKYAS